MDRFRSFLRFSGFQAFYLLSWPFLRLPLPVLYVLSDLFFFLLFYFPGYRKAVVLKNLRNSFPDKSDREIRSIARAFYRHLSDSFIESFAIANMSKEEFGRRCIWKNPEVLDKYYKTRKGVISIFGHYGNWEWMSGLPLYTEMKVLAVYKPLKNIWFDRYIKNLREKFGITAIAANRCLPAMIDYCNKDIPTITYFLGDQRPLREHIRYWTKFLNQDTPVLLGAEKIARRLDQAVVFFSMNKIKRGFYEVEIIPVTENPRSTSDYEITESHTRLLEQQIRNHPAYWLWSHKRWKHKSDMHR